MLASLIVTLALIALVGSFLLSYVARYQHIALDHDEGDHGSAVLRIAGHLAHADLRGFLRESIHQNFYPFAFSWMAAPVVLAFGASAHTLRGLNAVIFLLTALLAWGIAVDLARAHRWLAGLASAALVLTSAPLLAFSAKIYLDPAGQFFTLLALWAYTRSLREPRAERWLALTGALVAWSFLIKYGFGAFLVGGIAVNEFVRNRQARRWLPTRAQLILAGVAGGLAAIWLLLPGVLQGVRSYSGAQPPTAQLWALTHFFYYPRSLILQYSVSRLVGWLVMLALLAATSGRDERLRAWAIFVWTGIAILIYKRVDEPRFAVGVLPAAFVIAGPMIAQAFGAVARELRRRQTSPVVSPDIAERRFDVDFGESFQAALTVRVRRLWAESRSGQAVALAVVALAVIAAGVEVGRASSRRVATFDVLLPLTYYASPYPADQAGLAAMYDYIAVSVGDARRIGLFYGFLEMSGPALEWEIARRQLPGGRPQDVVVFTTYHQEASPENVAAVRQRMLEFAPEYIVVYADARYGGAHMEFNSFARAMKNDLQLVAAEVQHPTILEFRELAEALFDNQPLTPEYIEERVQAFLKPWPHHVDIYRYSPGAFADNPLPDLFAYFDIPDSDRVFATPGVDVEVGADFDGQVELLGYDISRQSATLTLTLYWRSQRWMPEDYHVFTHVFDPAIQTVLAGSDIAPRANGAYPTTWWKPGEVVSDTVTLDVSAVPPGTYWLGTGFYNFYTGERLPVKDASGQYAPDGWLPLDDNLSIP